MAELNQFELHHAGIGQDDEKEAAVFPWDHHKKPESKPAFTIQGGEGTVWAALQETTGQLKPVESPNEADFAFRVLKRRFSTDLAMLTRRHDVLVNGLPALNLTLLTTKDSVRLAPEFSVYVSERITPYVGAATEEHLGRKCPFCKLKITNETFVAVCRCGGAYHLESKQFIPDLSSEDRLECADKVQTCLACGNELVLSEHLLWDPASL